VRWNLSRTVTGFSTKKKDSDEKEHLISNRMDRALSLIMLGREKEGKAEVEKLKAENPQNMVFDEFLKRNKQDFIDDIFSQVRK